MSDSEKKSRIQAIWDKMVRERQGSLKNVHSEYLEARLETEMTNFKALADEMAALGRELQKRGFSEAEIKEAINLKGSLMPQEYNDYVMDFIMGRSDPE